MATSKLIQWLPEIVQATDEDIARFGPNAAQIRALLDFLPGMSDGGARVALDAGRGAARLAERDVAWKAAGNAARTAARFAEKAAAEDAAWFAASGAAVPVGWDAARAEVVSDLINPQTYRILTNPLNVGRVYDLRAREAGSEFMRLIEELRPASADDIERLADLSVDPRMPGIIELLQGLQGGMPLAAKIDAARRLDRASRAGRRLS